MFTNVKDFSELASYYDEFKEYPFQDEWKYHLEKLNRNNKAKTKIMPAYEDMSYEAQDFADKWINRFTQGATINGVPLTGEHLFYLNCVRMEIVKRKETKVSKGDFQSAIRTEGFPKFWDEDYKYYWGVYIARHGISRKGLARVQEHADLGLVETDDNLAGGKNHLWLKPRGVGASWKGGAWNAYNINLIPDTKNFIFADNDQFLGDNDGIFSKFITIRDFVQANIWFLRKHYSTEGGDAKFYETGFTDTEYGSRTTSGFNSSVGGVIVQRNPAKGRGKRGNGTFEEFGSFPKVEKTWTVFDASLQQYGDVFAQARGFGTGGDEASNYEDLEKMFRDPKTYRILQYKNIYEHALSEYPIAMFSPAYINTTDTDANGNSLIDVAKEKLTREGELKKQASDPSAYSKFRAEKPWEPGEAFNAVGKNILPVELAKEQLRFLEASNIDRQMCSYGKLEFKPSGGIKFVLTDDKPFEEYPVKQSHNKESAVVIFQQPFLLGGKEVRDLYRISVDPYAHAESEESDSLMDIRVWENKNPYTPLKGDVVVAWYRGRPEGHDGSQRACDILFKLAEMYNCVRSVGIENDQPGEVLSFAKTHRDSRGRPLTRYLAEQFEVDQVTEGGLSLKTKDSMKRQYGINMSKYRKEEGMKYLQQWYLRPRKELRNPDNTIKLQMNIHVVFDRGHLKEIIHYNGKNADAISSMIVGVYHEKELEYENRFAGKNKEADRFFSEQHQMFQ
jgi:hypothetical protein